MIVELNLITGQVVVTDESLTGLIDIKSSRKLLPAQVNREGVSSIIGEMNLSDLNGIIG